MASSPILNRQGGASTPGSRQIKSILRHGSAAPSSPATPSTVLGTRKRSDEDETGYPESPTKRKKSVHFDMDLNVISEIGTRTLEETKKQVWKALDEHARGDSELYVELKDIFANEKERYLAPIAGEEEDTLKPQELVLYVIALTSCAPSLNKSCSALVKTILQCSYLGRDDTFFKAYCQLMAALASAHGSYLTPILSMMVDKFSLSRPSSWSVPDFSEVDRETMQERLHRGLEYMLRLFPAARFVLCNLISQKFPYSDEPKRVHLAFIKNLLRIKDYASDLEPDVMEVITSRLVKLDSDMQLDLDDMDDELVSKVIVQLRNVPAQNGEDDDDDDDDASDDGSVASDDQTEFDAEATRIEKAFNLVRKLDAILDLLFGLYAPIFEKPESAPATATFEQMLSDFTNFVLPTQNCRHTQFLLFHYSQKSHALTDLFVGTLFNLAFQSNGPAAQRQGAAAFLGSFVARGAQVPRETVRSITKVLCHRIDAYRRNNEAGCRGPDLRRYQQLYSWFQAVIYIFCFRWKDLVDSSPDIVDPDDPSSYLGQPLDWMPEFRQYLAAVIHSPFNPLKVCSPPIVLEFTKLAQHLHLFYLYPKLEANKRIHLSQFVTHGYSSGGALRDPGHDIHDESWLQLEPRFPFDPYELPHSRRWLEGDYLAWKPIPGLHGDGDGHESDGEAGGRDEDEEGFDEDTATDDGRRDD